jgi:hypothetical protein
MTTPAQRKKNRRPNRPKTAAGRVGPGWRMLQVRVPDDLWVRIEGIRHARTLREGRPVGFQTVVRGILEAHAA